MKLLCDCCKNETSFEKTERIKSLVDKTGETIENISETTWYVCQSCGNLVKKERQENMSYGNNY